MGNEFPEPRTLPTATFIAPQWYLHRPISWRLSTLDAEARLRQFVYHVKPADLRGPTLLPLDRLTELHPDLAVQARAKYADDPYRRLLPERYIPALSCRWSEVVFLAPIHPGLTWRAWAAVGVELPEVTWLQIPVDRIAGLPAAVLSISEARPRDEAEARRPLDPADLAPFDVTSYQELSAPTPAALDWYRRLAAHKRHGGWFVGVPHVLVRGEVDIRDAAEIGWRAW